MNLKFREMFLTVFYSGKSPKAPGTVGSFVALFPGVLIAGMIHPSTLFFLSIFVTLIAVREINKYEEEMQIHDASEIVVDELVGMWIAISLAGVSVLAVIFSFAFFRLFDIWKPSYIGRIDRDVSGGWGVMGDDILAGVCAGLCSAVCVYLIGMVL